MKKIVVGISGASGMPLAVHLLMVLKADPSVETHLVMTRGAEITMKQEADITVEQVKGLADICYDINNIGASIASGTFRTEGMIVVPCSMKTVAGIARGYSDNLLLRACDVIIKEKRNLVLAVRETPLSPIHLDNLAYLSRLQNVDILPLVLSYYNNPVSIQDMERHLIGKLLSRFEIEVKGFQPWQP